MPCRSRRHVSVLLVCGLLGLPSCEPVQDAKDQPADKAPASLTDLSLEVGALQVFRQFQFTPDQFKMLRAFAKETVAEPEPRAIAKASPAFRKALADLRAALIKKVELEKLRD